MAYINFNQCRSTKSNNFKWILQIYTIWIKASMLQGKECGSIYFIIEKFPREVKCLCQGYIEVKSRNHSDCLPLRKCDLIGQWCPFSRNLSSWTVDWGPTDGFDCLDGLPVSSKILHWSEGEGFALRYLWEDVMSLPDGYVSTRHTAYVSNMWPKGSSDKNCVSPSAGTRGVSGGRIPDYNRRILVVSLATKSLTSCESQHMKNGEGY